MTSHRAIVTRLAGGMAYVSIPKRGNRHHYGPLQIYLPATPVLIVGAKVIITEIGDTENDLVITARMP